MKKIIVLNLALAMLFSLVGCSSNKTKELILEESFRTVCQKAGLTVSETETKDNGQTVISATGQIGVYYDKFDNPDVAEAIHKSYLSETPKSDIVENDKGKNYAYVTAIESKRGNIYNIYYLVDTVHIMISAGTKESEMELANKIIADLGY